MANTASVVEEEVPIHFVITPIAPLNSNVDNDSRPLSPNAPSVDKACSSHSAKGKESVLPICSSLSGAPDRFPFRRPWVGLVNMGNTCYANSILDCLFPFPELWDFQARQPLHQAMRAILVIMNVQPRDPSKATPLRPRIFLDALAHHISKLQKPRF